MPEAPAIRDSSPVLINVPPVDSFADAAFRHQMGHISRHSLVFFLGTIFTTASGYFFKVYLARALGAEALGIYALGMTVIGLLGVFNAFGLPQAAVRFVADYCATARVEMLRNFIARAIGLLLLSNLFMGGILLLIGPRIAARFYHTAALSRYFGLFALIMILGS
jgi:O-antigen/teichoic acid export membrane protein